MTSLFVLVAASVLAVAGAGALILSTKKESTGVFGTVGGMVKTEVQSAKEERELGYLADAGGKILTRLASNPKVAPFLAAVKNLAPTINVHNVP